jgi:hypothetical protein
MSDLTPRAKCKICDDEHVVANCQKQECWQFCPACRKHTNHTMTNIVRQVPAENSPTNDVCECGHERTRHSHITGVCLDCDCEGTEG